MATTDYDPATRRRLGIDPPLQRSIGNQQCPGCAELTARLDQLEHRLLFEFQPELYGRLDGIERKLGGLDRAVARHVTANHRHVV